MKKGILHVRKKPRHVLFEGKEIQIKKQMPEIGKEFDKLECEFDGNPVIKIIVSGKEFSADLKDIEVRKEMKKIKEESIKEYQKIVEQQAKGGDSFSLIHARVPIDTRNCLINNSDNFYLKLNQFARYDYKDNNEKDKHFKFINAHKIKAKKPERRTIVPEISIKPNFGNLFSKESQITQRFYDSASLAYPKDRLLSLTFKPEWRFVTGLGDHSVYETGITLHHIYGIPYIPASSIKGVLRSWIIYSEFMNNEGIAIQNKDFCEVFGCPAQIKMREGKNRKNFQSFFKESRKGKVTFFDALPLNKPTIEPDIMNPHYPDWYNGKNGSAPSDDQNPTPIFFLTVKNTLFQFLLSSKDFNLNIQKFWKDKTLGWWLENALAEHGIGAKTAVGYGYMKKI